MLRRWFERAPHPHSHHPRIVHRVSLECPYGHGPVEVDFVMGADGRPASVLHCSGRPRCDRRCDETCLGLREALADPAVLLLLPPGTGSAEGID